MYSRNWQYFTLDDYFKIPPKYINWLIRPYVLSRALKRICDEFSVQLISQEFGFLNDDEIEVLNCGPFELGLVRQTFLKGDGNKYVYARVVIPRATYVSNKEMLRIIGEKPIGESFLYNNPKMSRSIFQIKLLQPHHQLYKNAVHFADEKPAELWARRSIFHLDNDPMIINEVFFDKIPEYMVAEEEEVINIHLNQTH